MVAHMIALLILAMWTFAPMISEPLQTLVLDLPEPEEVLLEEFELDEVLVEESVYDPVETAPEAPAEVIGFEVSEELFADELLGDVSFDAIVDLSPALLDTEFPSLPKTDAQRETKIGDVPAAEIVLGPTEIPPVTTDNKNELGEKYRTKAGVTASSVWRGWPAAKVLDGDIKTSWFSAKGDAAALGTQPWVQINFPEDVVLSRVTILGNREPKWLIGYTILSGRVDAYNSRGRRIESIESRGIGNFRDFDFKFKRPLHKVRAVRFTSTADQGNHNPHKDIAIAEFQVE